MSHRVWAAASVATKGRTAAAASFFEFMVRSLKGRTPAVCQTRGEGVNRAAARAGARRRASGTIMVGSSNVIQVAIGLRLWYCHTLFKTHGAFMESYMTVKGQIVIPSKIRRKFGIKEGTRIQVEVDEQAHRIILTPVTRDYIQNLRGKYKGKGLLAALAAEKKREKDL